jgi:cholesterol transport system auxiliary component
MRRGVFLSLMCLAFLSACVMLRGTQDSIRTYALGVNDSAATMESPPSPSAGLPGLMVTVPESAPGFESPRMIYIQIPYELNAYANSQWVDSPARMLAPLIVRRLENSGLWRSVVQMPTPVRSDFRLDIGQVALAQEFFQEPSRVRFALRAQLTTIRDPSVRGTRSFEIVEDAPGEDAYGGVLAAQGAVNRLLDKLVEWLDGCVDGIQSQPC